MFNHNYVFVTVVSCSLYPRTTVNEIINVTKEQYVLMWVGKFPSQPPVKQGPVHLCECSSLALALFLWRLPAGYRSSLIPHYR